MCLITFQYNVHPDYPLILLANRDEFYRRPSSPIHFWEEEPDILAGRDLEKRGTWLGTTRSGRFSAISNHPFAEWDVEGEPLSRGYLVRDFLKRTDSPVHYALTLQETRHQYNGYHLLFGDKTGLFLYSNVDGTCKKYSSGLSSVVNTDDDLSRHKKERAEKLLSAYTQQHPTLDAEELIGLFQDTVPASAFSNIPDEVSFEDAKTNSSIFINGAEFGTVSTTVLLVDKTGRVTVREQRYDQQGSVEETQKEFQIEA